MQNNNYNVKNKRYSLDQLHQNSNSYHPNTNNSCIYDSPSKLNLSLQRLNNRSNKNTAAAISLYQPEAIKNRSLSCFVGNCRSTDNVKNNENNNLSQLSPDSLHSNQYRQRLTTIGKSYNA